MVAVVINNTVEAAVVVVNTILPVPKLMLRVLILEEEKIPVDKVKPFNTIEPAVNVVVTLETVVNALPNVHSPPKPLNVIAPDMVVPFVVIVFPVVVALNVIRPVPLQTVPVTKDTLPDIVGVPVLVNVTVPEDTVKSRQVIAPVIVTV